MIATNVMTEDNFDPTQWIGKAISSMYFKNGLVIINFMPPLTELEPETPPLCIVTPDWQPPVVINEQGLGVTAKVVGSPNRGRRS